MNYDNARDTLDRLMAVSSSLEKLAARLQKQAMEGEAAIRTTREREKRHFEQAMVATFRDHQQRMEAALQPRIIRAWQAVGAAACLLILLSAGWLMMMKQANDRLEAAQSRADATEVSAQVLEAMAHIEMTSCGGRPCIRIDKRTATWKSGGSEYVLVDGPRSKHGTH